MRDEESGGEDDKRAAEHTLYEVLTTFARLVAPYMPFLAEALYQNLVRRPVAGAPASVHHTDWPAHDEAAIDERLERAMTVVRRVVSVGAAARHSARVKVRMPLARLVVVVPDSDERALAAELRELIADELNVKAVDLVESAAERVELVVKPDLKVLGPKLGKDLARARKALETATVRPDGSVVAGEFTFAANEVLVERRPTAGWALAGEASYVALVDTRVTPELEAEGLAREIVHTIQNLRKEKGFDIADRIVLRYGGGIAAVMKRFEEYVKSEVLAVRVEQGTRDGAWSGTLNGVSASFEVERISPAA